MASAWSCNSCIEQPTQGVLSFCIHVAFLLSYCCLSYQVRQTCLLVARCMRLLGSAIIFSPLSRGLLCACCGLLVQGLQYWWTWARVLTAEEPRTTLQSQSEHPWLHPVMGSIAIA